MHEEEKKSMPQCAIVCCSQMGFELRNAVVKWVEWANNHDLVTKVFVSQDFVEVDNLVVVESVSDVDLMIFDILIYPNLQEASIRHAPRILKIPNGAAPQHSFFVPDFDSKKLLYKRRQLMLPFPNLVNVCCLKDPNIWFPPKNVHFVVLNPDPDTKLSPNTTIFAQVSLEAQHIICACCDFTTSEVLSYNCMTPFTSVFSGLSMTTESDWQQVRTNLPTCAVVHIIAQNSNPFHFKRLHQVWLSLNPLRPNNTYHEDHQLQWKALNPEMEYKLWHMQDVLKLIDDHYDRKILECFQQLAPIIRKCDFARLLIVNAFGGLYTDVDFIPVKAVRDWTPVYDCSGFLLFAEITEHSESNLCNGLFGCEKPDHPFLKTLISHIVEHVNHHADVMSGTGPTLWGNIHANEFSEIVVQNGASVMPITNHHSLSRDFDATRACWAFTEWNTGSGWGHGIETRAIVIDDANVVSLSSTGCVVDIWLMLFILVVCITVVLVIAWTCYRYRKSIFKRRHISTLDTGSPVFSSQRYTRNP
jgi:mannosyltransferase OCH1-like enzyme